MIKQGQKSKFPKGSDAWKRDRDDRMKMWNKVERDRLYRMGVVGEDIEQAAPEPEPAPAPENVPEQKVVTEAPKPTGARTRRAAENP